VNLVRQRAGRLLRAAVRRLQEVRRRRRAQVVDAYFELTERRRILGSVTVRGGAPAIPVELFLNQIAVAKTWVAPDQSSTSGANEIRTFSFATKDLWRFARQHDRVIVKVDGVPVREKSTGQRFVRPTSAGRRSPARLKQRLAQGHVFDQYGRLRISKKLDLEWQQSVMGLFADVRRFMKERYDHDLFFIYGTLLGAVREGGVIGHDRDLDTAFIATATDGRAAAAELRELAFALIDAGYVIDPYRTHIHVTDAAGSRIDVFHLYFDDGGKLCLPFGIAGTGKITRDDWQGVKEIDFLDGKGVIPANGEQFAELLYGSDWRHPKPGFHWPTDRTHRDEAGMLPDATYEEIYWANFYAHTHFDKGSTFFDFLDGRPDTPRTVIDIGCGDGRDSFAFAATDRRVLGLDRSHIAVRHAAKKAEQIGLGDRMTFLGVDVSDVPAVRAAFTEALAGSPDEPVLFYLRFFLHSIPEDVQAGLIDVIESCARPGDMLAAEFRTDQDEARMHVHMKHYRRYQNGPAFGESLRAHGFEVQHEEEGTGLSPYGDEDPHLYRVIALRR
jgi:SAM-dependent methyltransferase